MYLCHLYITGIQNTYLFLWHTSTKIHQADAGKLQCHQVIRLHHATASMDLGGFLLDNFSPSDPHGLDVLAGIFWPSC